MNPEGYPADAVPLQAGRYNVPPGQPGLPAVVQYTTVSVPIEPPKDHIIWSLFSFVHLNPCCLGLAALIHSIKARDRRAAGDLDGSRRHSSTACCLNIWATVMIGPQQTISPAVAASEVILASYEGQQLNRSVVFRQNAVGTIGTD
ncbi:dispanin subfamily A member 2b-like protein [Lates japonicus]|uniref:Dispanin subfamily A member 2b-like protein n=1 Tax=Lates japonicus TaxID=270547 RepID=A0AAD3NNG3_LATJO|nr:dispanin subfamily A member 2b-like protein [Lates japonicus]